MIMKYHIKLVDGDSYCCKWTRFLMFDYWQHTSLPSTFLFVPTLGEWIWKPPCSPWAPAGILQPPWLRPTRACMTSSQAHHLVKIKIKPTLSASFKTPKLTWACPTFRGKSHCVQNNPVNNLLLCVMSSVSTSEPILGGAVTSFLAVNHKTTTWKNT